MYTIEQKYVIPYLAISFFVHEIYATYHSDQYELRVYHQISQLGGRMPHWRASHLKSWYRLVQTVEHFD